MAEAEKKSDKPERKGSVLYDHKPTPKKAEPKKSEGSTKSEKTTVQTDLKSGEKAPKAQHEPAAADKKAEPAKPMTTAERHHKEREGVHKMHENERRDMHGNHREEQRQMHGRHQEAHKALAAKHLAEMMAEQQGGAGGPAAGPPGDVAAAAPQGAPAAAPGSAPPAPAAPAV